MTTDDTMTIVLEKTLAAAFSDLGFVLRKGPLRMVANAVMNDLDAREAKIARLRQALAQIASNDTDGLHMFTPQAMQEIARRALAGSEIDAPTTPPPQERTPG